LSNIYKEKKKARVAALLELVEMTEFAKVKAKYLSGGQQQRVAIARVLALEPELLLLDEPFSQIDSFRKNNLQRKVFNYLKEKQISCIVATHDSAEVLSFSDETIVMQKGKVIAIDTPKTLYEKPSSFYIASLFGEVNQILVHLLNSSNATQKELLVYPHQLQIVENSKLEVVVKQSYFKGNHYLIESIFQNSTIFFNHLLDLELGAIVYLDLVV
jgi:ABC-type sulfate/molybdate transport systems ATPase subunit